MKPVSARIVLVTADRGLRIIEPDGSAREITGLPDVAVLWGTWGAEKQESVSHTWPAFSPDGRKVAAFRINADQGSVWVSDLDGVESQVVVELPRQLPIYLQWSCNSAHVGVVSQLDNELLLTTARADGSSPQRVLVKGSPLFFTWTTSGTVAAFVGGGSPQARMSLVDPELRKATEILPGLPGDFCAPVALADGVIYGAHLDGASRLVLHSSSGIKTYGGGQGLMAFVPDPEGRLLALAVAPQGDGTPYQELSVLDLESGELSLVARMECLAFVWASRERGIVVARVDVDRGLVEWALIGLDGTRMHLMDMLPTRDMRFYLRFFEQYAVSHPIVDPDGRFLLLSGVAQGRGSAARVWRVPLEGGPPVDLGPGQFAAFGPRILH